MSQIQILSRPWCLRRIQGHTYLTVVGTHARTSGGWHLTSLTPNLLITNARTESETQNSLVLSGGARQGSVTGSCSLASVDVTVIIAAVTATAQG